MRKMPFFLLNNIMNRFLTAYHFRGHDSLSLAVFNGIVLWDAADQTGTGYRVPLAFESDIRLEKILLDNQGRLDYFLTSTPWMRGDV